MHSINKASSMVVRTDNSRNGIAEMLCRDAMSSLELICWIEAREIYNRGLYRLSQCEEARGDFSYIPAASKFLWITTLDLL